MSDERLGLPSSSMADRMMHCPGSPIPRPDEGAVSDENAERGNLIHEALRLRRPPPSLSELGVYDRLLELRNLTVEQWRSAEHVSYNRDDLRLYLRDNTLKRIFSGQPDEIVTGFTGPKKEVEYNKLVIDYKTGPTESVEYNWQLRSYAVLATQGARVPVRAAIIRESGADIVDWTPRELDLFEAELREGIRRMRPDAVRRAGNWCKFCPARGVCPKAGAWVVGVPAFSNPQAVPVGQRVLTIPQIAEIHRNRSAIISILDEVADVMKGMDAATLEAVGFRRKPNSPMRSFVNCLSVKDNLVSAGVEPGEVDAVMKLSVGDAEKLLQTSLGLTSKEAKALLNESCASLIALTPKSDSLEVIP